jgi:DNA-binding transcriptional regulator YiaG
MTQEEFADAIDVACSTVSRWENGRAQPSRLAWKAIDKLAKKRRRISDLSAIVTWSLTRRRRP